MMLDWLSGMRALFGSPVCRGATVSGFSHLDFLTADSSIVMGGVAPGVLLRVCIRCVLSFCLRTRGFVGLVLVVTGVAGAPTPSVAPFSLSKVGNSPPLIITTIAFFNCLFFFCLFSIVECSRSTLVLPPCSDVALVALGVGNAVEINHTTLRLGKLLFLAHKNACFYNNRTLGHNTIHRCPVFPKMFILPVPRTLMLLFLAAPLDVYSNHNAFHKNNGMPICLDVFCLCDRTSTLSTLAWSNCSTVALATRHLCNRSRWTGDSWMFELLVPPHLLGGCVAPRISISIVLFSRMLSMAMMLGCQLHLTWLVPILFHFIKYLLHHLHYCFVLKVIYFCASMKLLSYVVIHQPRHNTNACQGITRAMRPSRLYKPFFFLSPSILWTKTHYYWVSHPLKLCFLLQDAYISLLNCPHLSMAITNSCAAGREKPRTRKKTNLYTY